jgi:hypothetical protein
LGKPDASAREVGSEGHAERVEVEAARVALGDLRAREVEPERGDGGHGAEDARGRVARSGAAKPSERLDRGRRER